MPILFASDFDNTLLFGEDIHQEDIQAIASFQKEGHVFGLCTGRSLKGIKVYTEGKIRFDFYILATGSFILNSKEEVIYRKSIDLAIAKAITDEFSRHYKMAYNAGFDFYSLKTKYMEMTPVQNVSEVPNPIVGISFISESEEMAEKLCSHINETYPVSAFHNKAFVDITAKGCSKGTGIAFIQDHFQAKEIAGMGDSYNDLTLLKACHPSFTFPSSPKVLKDKVDVITGSVAESLNYLMK